VNNLNRAERRKLQKKKLSAKELKTIEDNSAKQAISYATNGMIASFVLTLHDKWGWGHVRIKRLLEQVDDMFDSVDKDYLTIEDMKKVIYDEVGIHIK